MNYITRKFIQSHRNILFIFGDNDARKGFGGMAFQFRGELNSIGIRTKKYPGMNKEDFYIDDELDENKRKIDEDIQAIIERLLDFTSIYVPVGIGEGYAKLQESAPETYKYLKEQLCLLSSTAFDSAPS